MALTIKNLGIGIIDYTSPAYEVLYAPVAGKSGLVKNILLTNTHSSYVTLDLKLKTATAPIDTRRIAPSSLTISPGGTVVIDYEITMGALDELQATASVMSKVEFVVNGVERDI